jgi:DedD protein
MEKDAYKDIFQGWVAKAAEYKMAISIAAACTVIVLISLVWPKPKPEPTISGITSSPPSSHPVATPATPPPASKPVAEAPATSATPATPTESPMQKELEAKPLFPPPPKPAPAPAQAAPAPKPQAMPAPITEATPQPVPVGYYVQVGSFEDKQHAIALAAKVEDKHWQSRLADRPGGLHAVWVGPYPTRAAVDKAKADLKRDGLPGFVVKAP